MNLENIAVEIRKILEDRRKEIELTFIEEDHKYFNSSGFSKILPITSQSD